MDRSLGDSRRLRGAECVFAALLFALAFVACDGYDPAGEGSSDARSLESVRGMVLDVEEESLISLKSLEVEDEEGTIWRFEGRDKVVPGFTPSHLREHKLLGLSVEVTFYRVGDALVLEDITD